MPRQAYEKKEEVKEMKEMKEEVKEVKKMEENAGMCRCNAAIRA